MKIGIDYHGVLNHEIIGPFFYNLCLMIIQSKGEVHLMTGSHGEDLMKEMETLGVDIRCTHFFSISDYITHKYPEEIQHDENNKPIVKNEKLWDGVKAEYAQLNKLDMVFDDNTNYVSYFTTPLCLVVNERNKELIKERPFTHRLINKQIRQPLEAVEP